MSILALNKLGYSLFKISLERMQHKVLLRWPKYEKPLCNAGLLELRMAKCSFFWIFNFSFFPFYFFNFICKFPKYPATKANKQTQFCNPQVSLN